MSGSNRPLAERYMSWFTSTSGAFPDELEVPASMMALVATAVSISCAGGSIPYPKSLRSMHALKTGLKAPINGLTLIQKHWRTLIVDRCCSCLGFAQLTPTNTIDWCTISISRWCASYFLISAVVCEIKFLIVHSVAGPRQPLQIGSGRLSTSTTWMSRMTTRQIFSWDVYLLYPLSSS